MPGLSIVVDERVARYVGRKVETAIIPPYTVMGIERDGEIVAGVLFNNMTGRDIEVTVAGECGAFTRGFLRAVGQYVFGALDRSRMSITTRQEHVADIAKRLGAKPEGVKRNHFGEGQHSMLFGILREEWKL